MALAKLLSQRSAQIEAFETETRDNAVHDISEVNDLIERNAYHLQGRRPCGTGPDPRRNGARKSLGTPELKEQ